MTAFAILAFLLPIGAAIFISGLLLHAVEPRTLLTGVLSVFDCAAGVIVIYSAVLLATNRRPSP